MCHGPKGDGKGDIVDSMKLTMHDWREPASLEGKTDGELFYIITKGKGKMMGEGDRVPETMRCRSGEPGEVSFEKRRGKLAALHLEPDPRLVRRHDCRQNETLVCGLVITAALACHCSLPGVLGFFS